MNTFQVGDTVYSKHGDRWGSPIERAEVVGFAYGTEEVYICRSSQGEWAYPIRHVDTLHRSPIDALVHARRDCPEDRDGIFAEHNRRIIREFYAMAADNPQEVSE